MSVSPAYLVVCHDDATILHASAHRPESAQVLAALTHADAPEQDVTLEAYVPESAVAAAVAPVAARLAAAEAMTGALLAACATADSVLSATGGVPHLLVVDVLKAARAVRAATEGARAATREVSWDAAALAARIADTWGRSVDGPGVSVSEGVRRAAFRVLAATPEAR